ncbi:MAG: hypothetical protein ABI629_04200, partial [bacterium]
NLKLVNQATCSGDSCPTAGCCGFATAEPPPAQMQAPAQQSAVASLVNACSLTDAATCDLLGGTFVAGGSCASGLVGACVGPTPSVTPTQTATATPTSTATPTATASQTATRTRAADGADCSIPSDCLSTFCVDGVCCNTACDGPQETCDGADPGTCTDVNVTAPAPALSSGGLLAGFGVMVLVALLAFWRRTRAN